MLSQPRGKTTMHATVEFGGKNILHAPRKTTTPYTHTIRRWRRVMLREGKKKNNKYTESTHGHHLREKEFLNDNNALVDGDGKLTKISNLSCSSGTRVTHLHSVTTGKFGGKPMPAYPKYTILGRDKAGQKSEPVAIKNPGCCYLSVNTCTSPGALRINWKRTGSVRFCDEGNGHWFGFWP